MNIRAFAAACAVLLMAGNAQAQSSTVSFTGRLLATTCTVSAGGNGGSSGGDALVILRPVPATQLAAAGARAGRQTFRVVVGSVADPCLVPRVQLGFRNSGNVNAQGRLDNVGTARNVDVVVSNAELNSGNPDIDLASNGNSQVRDIDPSTGWVALTYAGEYYATAPATGGTVVTSVQYDLIYP